MGKKIGYIFYSRYNPKINYIQYSNKWVQDKIWNAYKYSHKDRDVFNQFQIT